MTRHGPLFAVIALALVAILVGALLAYAGEGRRRAMAARIGAIAQAHGRGRGPVVAARPSVQRARRAPSGTAPLALLLDLIALDPKAGAQHPAPWRVILAIGVVVGAAVAWQGQRMFGMAGMLLGPLVGAGLCRATFAHGRRRYRERLHAQIPDVLAMVVRAVRAGIPVVEAVRAVAREVPSPTREEFTTLSAQVAVGMQLDAALWSLVRRSGVPEYSFFAVALTLQAQTGGSLAETLDNLADIVRRRIAIRARGLALAAEARMSAAVLTGVPVCTGIGLAVLNPAYMSILFNDPRGNNLLAAAGGMLLLGTLMIRMLIRRTLA
ncbi:MAG: type II secretion system F family protein [Acetobacteraceae bacterium]|nr:type II secretion system F family protein [Acetobacteraceae bacterium]